MPDINLGRIGFVPRGAYQTNTVYSPLDAVVYGNRLWACITQTATVPATNNAAWKLLLQGVSEELVGIGGSVDAIANTLSLRYTDGRLKVGAAVAGDDALQLAQMLAFPAVGGGLSVQGGHLYVDFGEMPTNKFETMLKSIRVPIWLTGNMTRYVRPDGNDANDGSANTPEKAFRTIQAAVNYETANFNLGVYTATINVANGIYEEALELPKYSGSSGYILIKGESRTGVIIQHADGITIQALAAAGTYRIHDLTVKATKTNALLSDSAILSRQGSSIIIQNVTAGFYLAEGVTAGGANILRGYSGNVTIGDGNCELYACVSGDQGSIISGIVADSSGSVNFTRDFAMNGAYRYVVSAQNLGLIRQASTPVPVITGNATGKRYIAAGNGIIQIGQGANYFPGSTAGSVSTGGQYL
jgi:hypothetical protein